jgi:hypothetical protein
MFLHEDRHGIFGWRIYQNNDMKLFCRECFIGPVVRVLSFRATIFSRLAWTNLSTIATYAC